ncbi:MAG: ComEC/Rec2 family competence protein [Treponema sp.]|nr:ComEC/Rec2 family competence protein [Candidatus Treponema equifaecale]
MVKNPVNISALVCAVLLFSGIVVPKNRTPFLCVLKNSQIVQMEGFVCSNPVKIQLLGEYYQASFSPNKCVAQNGCFSSSTGKINLLIPCDIVERFYPGKLYTSVRKSEGALVENGAKLRISVSSIQKSGFDDFFRLNSLEALGWKSSFSHFRAVCRLQFKRLMFAWKEAGGLLLALISGSREYTEKSVGEAFKNAGLSHVLALSGMHLSLFGGLAFFLGKKFSSKNLADGIQLAAITFFVWFAGISPSLFRAFLSAVLIFLSSLFRINRPESVSVLSFTFLLHILIFPDHIQNAGFMLSYGSLAGILIFSNFFRKILPVFFPYKLRCSLAASCSAQLATSPVVLKLFGKIMPIGILASVLVSPIVVIFLYFGLFGMIICLVLPFLSRPLSVIMNVIYYIIKLLVINFNRFS